MSSKSQNSEGRGVQSIEIGTQLLEALVTCGEPMMLKELAAVAGIAPAQAHPYLVSFRNLGMVEQNGPAGRYQLGPFALDLAITRMRTVDPMQLAEQAVAELSLETGLTVLLSVWGAFGPTVVVVHEGEDQIHMNTKVGTVYSVTGTATGRIFAAYLPPNLINPSMRSNLPKSFLERCVGTPQPYDETDIAMIRKTGISSVPNPPVRGINAIASPIFDHLGQILAVVTLVGDARILVKAPTSAFARKLVEATRRLSSELGYWDEEKPQ
ncbi:IclR family transcriptional regulator [Halomonas sp. HAL1]|uniref:IclR family transcriptional regulator n=1 Tax=Halomonas sp. HAL1 TaxID=550984 RepID=UPI00022D2C0F|nr:IclR family transcriptional regulator [Halomonas sp. HAL1]EHA17529.1 IclR family transcriptional regulator [Halomonas sp. HAL1]WKV92679.1 IclR family transcriptional regulator [Halomonas sp. HAL1]